MCDIFIKETCMETTTSIPASLTFEQVWAVVQETALQMKETDRKMQETDLKMQETALQMKETDRRLKETNRLIGGLGNRFGELAEHLVTPGIREKFNALGFNFTEQSLDKEIRDHDNPNAYTEVDMLLENGDIVIAIEIKSKPKQADVDEHITRMEVLRKAANRRNDVRKYQGAIAGAIMSQATRDYVLQNGFYVIEQTGDTVQITFPEGFSPREW